MSASNAQSGAIFYIPRGTIMNEFYQLALSTNGDFQHLISTQLARLELIPDIRSSKRRLVHAGILSLRTSDKETLSALSAKLIMEKSPRGVKVKHQVIQVDQIFADLARYISASAAVELGFRKTTRVFMHLALISLTTCTDSEFSALVYASEAYEQDQSDKHSAL